MQAAMSRVVPAFLLLALLFLPTPAFALEEGNPQKQGPAASAQESRGYATLPALLAQVGSEAMAQFQDFFDLAPLVVEPFVHLRQDAGRPRISLLGAMLAEQMAVVLGNEALVQWPLPQGELGQYLSGSLLETDGYLRVQISGSNTRGELRSHVVNVEMSEPIYRALHTFISHR
jgi:hypothetical protein